MIFAGGIWTVGVVTALAFGYARVFDARRWVYFLIMALAVIVIIASQFLPSNHLFNLSIKADLKFLFWATVIAVPVGVYAMLVRIAHQKAGARHDP